MKEFAEGNEQERRSDDQHREDSFVFNHSEAASRHEIAALFERSLQKIHEWYDMKTCYVYFKEKRIGNNGKTGK